MSTINVDLDWDTNMDITFKKRKTKFLKRKSRYLNLATTMAVINLWKKRRGVMPNFCENIVTFTHDNVDEIQKMKKLVEETKLLFSHYVPEPEDYSKVAIFYEGRAITKTNDKWWYWRHQHWGTKTDPSDIDIDYVEDDPHSITFFFHTAWNPPIEFFDKMVDLGWGVECTYEEEALQLVGRYNDKKSEYADNLFENFIDDKLPLWVVEEWGEEILERLHMLGRIDDECNLIDTEKKCIEKPFGEWGHRDMVEEYRKDIA
jgi:hypothetical protein